MTEILIVLAVGFWLCGLVSTVIGNTIEAKFNVMMAGALFAAAVLINVWTAFSAN